MGCLCPEGRQQCTGLCPKQCSAVVVLHTRLLLPIVRFLGSAHQSLLCCQNTAVLLGRAQPLAPQLGRAGESWGSNIKETGGK